MEMMMYSGYDLYGLRSKPEDNADPDGIPIRIRDFGHSRTLGQTHARRPTHTALTGRLPATPDSLFSDLLIAAEVRWKNWSDAGAYGAVWDDQTTAALGIQKTLDTGLGALALRAGYSWSEGLRKDFDDLESNFGGLTTLAAPNSTGALPITPTFNETVQATIVNSFSKQSISFGAGLQLTDILRVDGNAGYAFDGEESFNRFESDVNVWHVGGGITWTF